MKRSERLYSEARQSALMALLSLCASVCAGVWSVRATMSTASGGVLVFVVALAGLCMTAALVRECARLMRMAEYESRYEWERSIRPRL